MKKRNGMRRICAVLLLLMAICLCGYSELDPKIFDDAKLLSAAEEETLQQEIVEVAKKLSLDVIIVTTDDAQGKSAERYADDFYDDHAFGYEKDNGSGILLLIDMDNREAYISTAGVAMEMYTDRDVYDMLDYEIMTYLADGNYYRACHAFVACLEEYGTNAEVATNGYYDAEKDAFVEYTKEELSASRREEALKQVFSAGNILTRLGIGMLIGAAGVGLMVLNVRKSKAPGGRVYMKPGSERIRDRQDYRVNTTVTTRRIQRSSGSSGGGGGRSSSGHTSSHRSGSGRSHGGGGRKF